MQRVSIIFSKTLYKLKKLCLLYFFKIPQIFKGIFDIKSNTEVENLNLAVWALGKLWTDFI